MGEITTLTQSTRGTQVRRLYAALRQAGYLAGEDEVARFERRLGDALFRLGFYAIVVSDEEVGMWPESFAADTALLGGDSEIER